jgi:hypothetical protein
LFIYLCTVTECCLPAWQLLVGWLVGYLVWPLHLSAQQGCLLATSTEQTVPKAFQLTWLKSSLIFLTCKAKSEVWLKDKTQLTYLPSNMEAINQLDPPSQNLKGPGPCDLAVLDSDPKHPSNKSSVPVWGPKPGQNPLTYGLCFVCWNGRRNHGMLICTKCYSLPLVSFPICWFVGLSCHPDINVTVVWSHFWHMTQLNPSSHNYTFSCLVTMSAVWKW